MFDSKRWNGGKNSKKLISIFSVLCWHHSVVPIYLNISLYIGDQRCTRNIKPDTLTLISLTGPF